MKPHDSHSRAEARSLCADLHQDDRPPASRRKEERSPGAEDRKTLQLCAQVQRALHGVIPIPGESDFDGLIVEAVEPDPDASRLRIIITIPPSAPVALSTLRQRLSDLTGFIRSEITPHIHRKRVPQLTFVLLPREEEC